MKPYSLPSTSERKPTHPQKPSISLSVTCQSRISRKSHKKGHPLGWPFLVTYLAPIRLGISLVPLHFADGPLHAVKNPVGGQIQGQLSKAAETTHIYPSVAFIE